MRCVQHLRYFCNTPLVLRSNSNATPWWAQPHQTIDWIIDRSGIADREIINSLHWSRVSFTMEMWRQVDMEADLTSITMQRLCMYGQWCCLSALIYVANLNRAQDINPSSLATCRVPSLAGFAIQINYILTTRSMQINDQIQDRLGTSILSHLF